MDSDKKDITLKYNDFEIPIKIVNDYDKSFEIIRKSLYLTHDDLKKLKFYFYDNEGDSNHLTEDTFDDALESNTWEARRKKEQKPKPTQDPEEMNKMIDKTRKECFEIMNKKIKEINDKWKKKMDSKINELKNKFRKELEERETINKSNIEDIIKHISNNAQEKIEKEIKNYNENIDEYLNGEIKSSVLNLNKEKDEFLKNKNDLNNYQEGIRKAVEDSKSKFENVMSFSQVLNK